MNDMQCNYVVFIITDDQDVKLGSLHVQPKVKSLLIEQGIFFENAFVTTPVCCPTRFVSDVCSLINL